MPSINRRTFLNQSTGIILANSIPGMSILSAAPSRQKPLRIGLVSAATYGHGGKPRTSGSHHGTAFATTFNGWDEDKAKQFEGTFVRSKRQLEQGRVVKIWDPNREAARKLAEAARIESVADSPEDCCKNVDAVILIDDGSGAQWKYADFPLKNGVPTFCDKPLAMTAREAAKVAKLSKETGTPFMSASSLRFVPDILKLKAELPRIGDVHLAHVICGNDLIYYGIHALSMAYEVLGPGAVSAVNVGSSEANIVRIRFRDGRNVMLTVAAASKMRAGYQISLYGTKQWRTVNPDLTHLYSYLLEAFLKLAIDGVESFPIDQEVELIAALEAAQKSLELGREVLLSEVLG